MLLTTKQMTLNRPSFLFSENTKKIVFENTEEMVTRGLLILLLNMKIGLLRNPPFGRWTCAELSLNGRTEKFQYILDGKALS